MKKTVLIYGLIAGFICSISFFFMGDEMNFDKGMIYGFGSMILAFSLIFVAVKNYRDKHNGGSITFGKAFTIGFFVALIASTVYVLSWLYCLNYMFPDFADKYTSYIIDQMQEKGATAAEITPVIVILYTYMEILPLGIIIALITAAFLKKKPQLNQTT